MSFCQKSRRQFLKVTSGALFLAGTTGSSLVSAAVRTTGKTPHRTATAKRLVFITLKGGPSHLDLFDPKPALRKLHGKTFIASATAHQRSVQPTLVASPFGFTPTKDSSIPLNNCFHYLRQVAHHVCFIRNISTSSANHTTALNLLHCGDEFSSHNTLTEQVLRLVTQTIPSVPPLILLPDPLDSTAALQLLVPQSIEGMRCVPLAARLNGDSLAFEPVGERNTLLVTALPVATKEPGSPDAGTLPRVCNEIRTAWQHSIQQALRKLAAEPEYVLKQYGLRNGATSELARYFLLARLLIEQGTQIVHMTVGGWDAHTDLAGSYQQAIHRLDQTLAAFIDDLDQRGLLCETLIVCAGEFGRAPYTTTQVAGDEPGRDHNPAVVPVLLAGSRVRGGRIIGETDELGLQPVGTRYSIHDLHTAILGLFGLTTQRLPTQKSCCNTATHSLTQPDLLEVLV